MSSTDESQTTLPFTIKEAIAPREIQSFQSRINVVPRDYQLEAVNVAFKLFDAGQQGVLMRAATGLGKTLIACMAFERWLARSDNHRCLVVSYERELVHQFSAEIEEWLGIVPGIEMSDRYVGRDVPSVVVACRQSLQQHELATLEQRQFLESEGFTDLRLLTKCLATKLIRVVKRGGDCIAVADAIRRHNSSRLANHEVGAFSRLHRLLYTYDWLVCYDEAHKHAAHLKQIGHLVSWFARNPNSRRLGITATPRRSDNVSIGKTMFPGVALDLPLVSVSGRNALNEGWAVPYIQAFITVNDIDFSSLKRIGKDFDPHQLNELLNQEEQLAKLCEPLLDLCGDRLTLVFSPTVEMARNVARYLNARSQCECHCGQKQWHPSKLIGDGSKCKSCGQFLGPEHVIRDGTVAESVDGTVPHEVRREIYERHKRGVFIFLSCCCLCREGFNSRPISCVAIFRPVSKAASSLAEQMRGRGVRPLPNVVEGLASAEERRAAIAASEKKDCLIIDLVGSSGLPDCASTISIYCEGLDDEVVERANQIAISGGMPISVEQAIEKAVGQLKEEREAKRQARLEAERLAREQAAERAKLGAKVNYSIAYVNHDVSGFAAPPPMRNGQRLATDKQLGLLWHLGLKEIEFYDRPTLKAAGRMISQIRSGVSVKDVIYRNGLKSKFKTYLRRIEKAKSHFELTQIATELKWERRMNKRDYEEIVELGRLKRRELTPDD